MVWGGWYGRCCSGGAVRGGASVLRGEWWMNMLKNHLWGYRKTSLRLTRIFLVTFYINSALIVMNYVYDLTEHPFLH